MNKDVSVSISEVSNGFLLKVSELYSESDGLETSAFFVEKTVDDVLSRVRDVFSEDEE